MLNRFFIRRFLVRFGNLGAKYESFIHIVGLTSIAISVTYLFFRVSYTWQGSHPIAFAILLFAEVFSFLTFVLFLYDSWRIPPVNAPEKLNEAVDIVITTYDEDVSILEPTIVSSLRVNNVGKVWVLDDGRRAAVAELCKLLDVNYVTRPDNKHAKAGNINHALPIIDAELILFLDADHVPSREIVEKLSGYFADPKVAVVQSSHGFRNRDSSQHRDLARHEQSLFYEVLMPARDKSQSAFWSGSAAILRKSALEKIGGVATETITEDLHTSLKLQRAGYLVRYHNETLVSALAPHTAADYLLQRDRWARGTLSVLTSSDSPIFGKGWKLGQRIHYLNNFLYYLIPFQRLAYVGSLVLLFFFGWLPISNVSSEILILILLNLFMTGFASVLFARGKRDAFDGTQFTWLSASIHLKALIDLVRKRRTPFAVTPKVATQRSFWEKVSLLRLPIIVFAVLLVALIYSALHQLGILNSYQFLNKWVPGIHDSVVFWWATFFLFLELFSLERLLRHEFKRNQVRALWRFQTQLPGYINGSSVLITDIHESGVAFESANNVCEIGVEAPLNIELEFVTKNSGVESKYRKRARGFITPVRILQLPDRIITAGTLRWASNQDRWDAQDLCYAHLAISEQRTSSPLS